MAVIIRCRNLTTTNIISARWEELVDGGWGNAIVEAVFPSDDIPSVGDALDIYKDEELVWSGSVESVEEEGVAPRTVRIEASGPVARLATVPVFSRYYAHSYSSSADVGYAAVWLNGRFIAPILGAAEDASKIDTNTGYKLYYGDWLHTTADSVIRAIRDQSFGQVAWGFFRNSVGEYQLYFRRLTDSPSYVLDDRSITLTERRRPISLSEVVNAIRLVGGTSQYANLLPNGSLRYISAPGWCAGNLLTDGGFETDLLHSVDSYSQSCIRGPKPWLTAGNNLATRFWENNRYQIKPRTGEYCVEFDPTPTAPEYLWQIVQFPSQVGGQTFRLGAFAYKRVFGNTPTYPILTLALKAYDASRNYLSTFAYQEFYISNGAYEEVAVEGVAPTGTVYIEAFLRASTPSGTSWPETSFIVDDIYLVRPYLASQSNWEIYLPRDSNGDHALYSVTWDYPARVYGESFEDCAIKISVTSASTTTPVVLRSVPGNALDENERRTVGYRMYYKGPTGKPLGVGLLLRDKRNGDLMLSLGPNVTLNGQVQESYAGTTNLQGSYVVVGAGIKITEPGDYYLYASQIFRPPLVGGVAPYIPESRYEWDFRTDNAGPFTTPIDTDQLPEEVRNSISTYGVRWEFINDDSITSTEDAKQYALTYFARRGGPKKSYLLTYSGPQYFQIARDGTHVGLVRIGEGLYAICRIETEFDDGRLVQTLELNDYYPSMARLFERTGKRVFGLVRTPTGAEPSVPTVPDVPQISIDIPPTSLPIYVSGSLIGGARSLDFRSTSESIGITGTYEDTGQAVLDLSASHQSLLDLQGGTASERYHLTADQHAGLTGGGNTSLHLHDDRYGRLSATNTWTAANIYQDWIRGPNTSMIRETYFGYSQLYRVVQIGALGSQRAIAIGCDPSTVTGGAFSGDEIVLPNAVEILTPNSSGSDFLSLIQITNGKIGLRTSPSYTLDVGGTIRAEGGEVIARYNASGWPSYGLYFYNSGSSGYYPMLKLVRGRGSTSSPSDATVGDYIGAVNLYPRVGGAEGLSVSLHGILEAVSGTYAQCYLQLQMRKSDGTWAYPQRWRAGVVEFPIGVLALGSSTATSGAIRLPNQQYIVARNAANTGDIQLIGADASNRVVLGGSTAQVVVGDIYSTGNISLDTGKTVDGVDVDVHAQNPNAHHNQQHALDGEDHTLPETWTPTMNIELYPPSGQAAPLFSIRASDGGYAIVEPTGIELGNRSGSVDLSWDGTSLSLSQPIRVSGNIYTSGNITLDAGKTVDGVDVDAHAQNPDAHHNRQHALDGGDHVLPTTWSPSMNIDLYPPSGQWTPSITTRTTDGRYTAVRATQIEMSIPGSYVVLNWDGTFLSSSQPIQASRAKLTGNPPLELSSRDRIINLNADLLDGYEASEFGRLNAANSWTITQSIFDVEGPYSTSLYIYKSVTSSSSTIEMLDLLVSADAQNAVPSYGSLIGINTAVQTDYAQSCVIYGTKTEVDYSAPSTVTTGAVYGSRIAVSDNTSAPTCIGFSVIVSKPNAPTYVRGIQVSVPGEGIAIDAYGKCYFGSVSTGGPYWTFGGYTGGTITATGYVTVTLDGTTYRLLASTA
ncbi:hypothetical protein [Thermogutta sp.]|uniref:hypothetical protein n=1 Tax=Thermogutta sp. TaxID=1962930 RepID=UPI0032207437